MATPISIEIKKSSNTCYFVGEASNVKVRSINVTYDDGTVKALTSGYTVSQVDTSEAGEKISIVEYSGLTVELAVTVVDSYNVQAGTPNLEDVNITFDLETGLLKVTGTGEFLSLSNIENTPSSIKTRIKKVNIGNGITKIPVDAFGENKNLEDISFPNTLEEICDGNFYSTKITQIIFPQSLRKIGQSCFSSSALISLEIPDSVLEIGSSSFSNLSSLKNVIFHEGLETISPVAFNECPLITELALPSTLKNMQYNFQGSSLKSLEMGGEGTIFSSSGSERISNISAKSMTIRGGTIDNGAFYYNTTIENLSLGETVKWNGSGQFGSCSKLSSVLLENGITSIPDNCFSSCELLDNVVIPDSVTRLGTSAFTTCETLKTITLSQNITSIPDNCFSSCGFIQFSIPDDSKIESIGNSAFQRCSNLKSVYIGKSVKIIGSGAFYNTNLTTIRINQTKDSISGAPWSATNATIEWLIKVIKVEILSQPSKLKYKIGEVFDSSGLTVKATYDDGTSKEISDYTLSSPDMSNVGNKVVTITYDGQTATFDITVIDISKIEITSLPDKTEYMIGDEFDNTGLIVSAVYTDGSKEQLSKEYIVSGFSSKEPGDKILTVTYRTFTATFSVNVVAEIVGIRISHYPNKIYYKIGELFDSTGLVVAVVRKDGTEKEIADYDISGFDSSTAGSKTITVSYNTTINGVSKFVGSDSFQIKVTNDGKNPFDDSTSDSSGDVEEEKTEPIKVTVHWINGEFADLTNENIDQNTLTLQESICSESYFIFGGCVCNQITFQAHHDQFNGTSEEFYPSGKIEVYIERKGTKIKIFTGEIDSAERKVNSLTRNFIAYDYLYKLRNTDITRWYKNQTTDKKKKLTQKQFRDKLFEFLGLEQVSTKLHWDDTYVPDTNNSNEMNVVNILKDLCLQNDRFGWMNRDGKFEYLKLRQNSYKYGQTTGNQNIYKYYNNEEVHLDTFKSFTAKEGRIWFPNIIFCDPDPNRAFGFTQGDYTAQEAYDNNVYYNRNSFFVGNEDWLNYVWDADEYGGISRSEPIMKICYGVFVDQDLRKYYRAQGYTAEVQGNPLNMVGQAVELYYKKQIQHDNQEPIELQWYVHSYIMSRILKIGATDMIDTYSANNAPFNSNSQQLGKYTPEISGTVNLTRSEMPTISYAEFTDGSDSEFSPAMIDDFTDGSGGSGSTSEQLKKAQLRCVKRIKKSDYDALVAAGTDRTDTLYFTFEEG